MTTNSSTHKYKSLFEMSIENYTTTATTKFENRAALNVAESVLTHAQHIKINVGGDGQCASCKRVEENLGNILGIRNMLNKNKVNHM